MSYFSNRHLPFAVLAHWTIWMAKTARLIEGERMPFESVAYIATQINTAGLAVSALFELEQSRPKSVLGRISKSIKKIESTNRRESADDGEDTPSSENEENSDKKRSPSKATPTPAPSSRIYRSASYLREVKKILDIQNAAMTLDTNSSLLSDVTKQYKGTMVDLMRKSYLQRTTFDRLRNNDAVPEGFDVVKVFRFSSTTVSLPYDTYKKEMLAKFKSFDEERCLHSNGNKSRTSKVGKLRKLLDPSPCLNEQFLFHGTRREAAQEIGGKGFDLERAGSKVGTMLGPGVYLTDASTKADEYTAEEETVDDEPSGASAEGSNASYGNGSRGHFSTARYALALLSNTSAPTPSPRIALEQDAKFVRRMLLCKVVLGRPLLLDPIKKNAAQLKWLNTATLTDTKAMLEKKKLDSILRDGEYKVPRPTFKEFVVFEQAAVLPFFIIEYTRKYGKHDSSCPKGFRFTPQGLADTSKEEVEIDPLITSIDSCVDACNEREGCIALQYLIDGDIPTCFTLTNITSRTGQPEEGFISCLRNGRSSISTTPSPSPVASEETPASEKTLANEKKPASEKTHASERAPAIERAPAKKKPKPKVSY